MSGAILAKHRDREMCKHTVASAQTPWRFPEKEGRRNLPVTACGADGYPHQLKANKERKDKNNRVRPCCLDNHNVKLLRYWESGERLPPGPRCSGEVRITGSARVCVWAWGHVGGSLYVFSCMSVCCRACLFVTHTMQQDHTVLLVCGISRFKIGPSVGGGQEQTAERGGEEKGEEKRGEGRESGDDTYCTRGRLFIFIRMLRCSYPPVNNRGEVSVVCWNGRCYGMTDGKWPSLLNCHC